MDDLIEEIQGWEERVHEESGATFDDVAELEKILQRAIVLRDIASLAPDSFFASLFSFSFCKGYKSCTSYKKLFTSLHCLKRKGLYTNATDLRQNSADRPFNLSLNS